MPIAELSRRKSDLVHRSLVIVTGLILGVICITIISSNPESSSNIPDPQNERISKAIEDVPFDSDESEGTSPKIHRSTFDQWFRVASEDQWFGSSIFGDAAQPRNKKMFLTKADCAAAEDAGLLNISQHCIYVCEPCDLPDYRCASARCAALHGVRRMDTAAASIRPRFPRECHGLRPDGGGRQVRLHSL